MPVFYIPLDSNASVPLGLAFNRRALDAIGPKAPQETELMHQVHAKLLAAEQVLGRTHGDLTDL